MSGALIRGWLKYHQNDARVARLLDGTVFLNTRTALNVAVRNVGRMAKGGRERAKRLSKKRRSEIARNAALARWGKK